MIPITAVAKPARIRTSHTEMWMPGASASNGSTSPKWTPTPEKCDEASHAAT